MRDELPPHPFKNESGVINLDSSQNHGTHWVAYVKLDNFVEYFDSYGNLKPPKEFLKYMGSNLDINYNYINYQGNHPFNCGHLCINFLKNFWRSNNFR